VRDLELPLELHRGNPTPLREQIVGQLRSAIAEGVLRAGHRMPSSRVLARGLGIARSTVIASYLELEGEGWISSRHGAGTFVAPRPGLGCTGERAAAFQPDPVAVLDARPGDLDPSIMSMPSWRAAWRGIAPHAAPPPPAGSAELRDALAAHLGSARGLRCGASEIVLCAGTNEAMVLLGLALGWAGRAIAVEDPGYPQTRAALDLIGVRWVPVDVSPPDTLLALLADLPEPPAAVYLTPSHQYPLGHRIGPQQRRDLLAWANIAGALIVEDDYDAEFRFGVAPLPSLAGLDPSSDVVYVGTLSKVLDPGLRLTYLRVPPHRLRQVLRARSALGSTTPWPVQQAVTELLRSGGLARHIARVRRLYADRRQALLSALQTLPAVTGIEGIEAGLHVVAHLRAPLDAAAVRRQARSRGLLVADLDEFRARPRPDRPALVLGYSKLDPAGLRRAVGVLAALPALAV
jgi:GntR family transcriptional regulator/MocR family aminotransferase